MKRMFALAFAVLLAAALPAAADPGGQVYQSWQSLGRLASAISVTNATAATALPDVPGALTARVCNLGSAEAYIALGVDDTVTTTATTGSWVKQATCMAYNLRPVPGTIYDYVAAITASSTTTLYVEVGNGNW